METEDLYTMMMDALDGELAEAEWAELEVHLRARPQLQREWEAMRMVDALFSSTPLLQPAAGFAQRTMARLPGSRQRLWAGVLIYFLVLAAGIVPLIALGWIAVQLMPALGQPALFRSLAQGVAELARLLGVVLDALLDGAGQLVGQRPTVVAGLLLMVSVVLLWFGVYNRLVLRHQQRRA
jgi:anti-sigma factor RsiW